MVALLRYVRIAAAALLVSVTLCVAASAQNEFVTPTQGKTVVGVGNLCLNSSGQMVPMFSASGTYQCAGAGLPIVQPDTRGTGTLNSATPSAAYSVSLSNGEGVTGFSVTGLTASGATLTIEASDDAGVTWAAVNGITPSTGILFSTLTTDQQFRVNTGGRTNVRLRVSSTGTGTITVASTASSVSSAVALSSPIPPGANIVGKFGIDQTTPGTTNGVALTAATTGGATTSSTIIPNNTTAIVVKGSPGQLYGVECWNNNTTIAYIKVYDAISATAGVGTPAARYMCPASSSGSGFVRIDTVGRQYLTGITYIVTTGIADNDTTAPAANTYIVNVGYK